jgi:hypothetical protein
MDEKHVDAVDVWEGEGKVVDEQPMAPLVETEWQRRANQAVDISRSTPHEFCCSCPLHARYDKCGDYLPRDSNINFKSSMEPSLSLMIHFLKLEPWRTRLWRHMWKCDWTVHAAPYLKLWDDLGCIMGQYNICSIVLSYLDVLTGRAVITPMLYSDDRYLSGAMMCRVEEYRYYDMLSFRPMVRPFLLEDWYKEVRRIGRTGLNRYPMDDGINWKNVSNMSDVFYAYKQCNGKLPGFLQVQRCECNSETGAYGEILVKQGVRVVYDRPVWRNAAVTVALRAHLEHRVADYFLIDRVYNEIVREVAGAWRTVSESNRHSHPLILADPTDDELAWGILSITRSRISMRRRAHVEAHQAHQQACIVIREFCMFLDWFIRGRVRRCWVYSRPAGHQKRENLIVGAIKECFHLRGGGTSLVLRLSFLLGAFPFDEFHPMSGLVCDDECVINKIAEHAWGDFRKDAEARVMSYLTAHPGAFDVPYYENRRCHLNRQAGVLCLRLQWPSGGAGLKNDALEDAIRCDWGVDIDEEWHKKAAVLEAREPPGEVLAQDPADPSYETENEEPVEDGEPEASIDPDVHFESETDYGSDKEEEKIAHKCQEEEDAAVRRSQRKRAKTEKVHAETTSYVERMRSYGVDVKEIEWVSESDKENEDPEDLACDEEQEEREDQVDSEAEDSADTKMYRSSLRKHKRGEE